MVNTGTVCLFSHHQLQRVTHAALHLLPVRSVTDRHFRKA